MRFLRFYLQQIFDDFKIFYYSKFKEQKIWVLFIRSRKLFYTLFLFEIGTKILSSIFDFYLKTSKKSQTDFILIKLDLFGKFDLKACAKNSPDYDFKNYSSSY